MSQPGTWLLMLTSLSSHTEEVYYSKMVPCCRSDPLYLIVERVHVIGLIFGDCLAGRQDNAKQGKPLTRNSSFRHGGPPERFKGNLKFTFVKTVAPHSSLFFFDMILYFSFFGVNDCCHHIHISRNLEDVRL